MVYLSRSYLTEVIVGGKRLNHDEMTKMLNEDPLAGGPLGCCWWYDDQGNYHQQDMTLGECQQHTNPGTNFAIGANCSTQ
jgi:hypothetical protein